MTKLIANLHTEIYKVLDATSEHTPNLMMAGEYGGRIGDEMGKATLKRDGPRVKGKLWASDLGKKCLRQHWYRFNKPECGDGLLGYTKFKFLYGNILEEACLYLAEEAGYEVSHTQHRVEMEFKSSSDVDWMVSGRIDAIINGVLVDVKSTSSFGFNRYKYGIDPTNDSFGYIQQISFYSAFGEYDTTPTESGFVWIDKQNGHIKYTRCATEGSVELTRRAVAIADAIETTDEQLVPRGYEPEPYGKSGNEVLPISCSYCSFKRECWRDSNNGRGLRTFAYNHKPIDFTTVTREPKVPEVKHGGT